jgi:hypothetical protein
MDDKIREQLIFIERKLSVEENHAAKDSLLCQALTIIATDSPKEMRKLIQRILAAYKNDYELIKDRWD